jgi:hypothetical protein
MLGSTYRYRFGFVGCDLADMRAKFLSEWTLKTKNGEWEWDKSTFDDFFIAMCLLKRKRTVLQAAVGSSDGGKVLKMLLDLERVWRTMVTQ